MDGTKPNQYVEYISPSPMEIPLGIPTMQDRAIQGIVKSSLEPIWEARFEPHSYGFRPAHSTHDAINLIFSSLNTEMDIRSRYKRVF